MNEETPRRALDADLVLPILASLRVREGGGWQGEADNEDARQNPPRWGH